MDSQIIYSIFGIVIFIIIIIVTMRSKSVDVVQSSEEKKTEIINSYKQELRDSLEPLAKDADARVAKKSELLKRFSQELSQNIFFDDEELREIILELSKEG